MVCLATQVMMGIVSTGITEGKGRAGVMIPIPGYSMYQARLLQHNTHQVIPIRVTWRRFPRSLFQAFKKYNAVFGWNRTRRKRGESGARARELSSRSRYFFSSLINFSTALYYLNAWNRLLPARSDSRVASYFKSCFHYRSRIFLYLVCVAGGFVCGGAAKRSARRVERPFAHASGVLSRLYFVFHACWTVNSIKSDNC